MKQGRFISTLRTDPICVNCKHFHKHYVKYEESYEYYALTHLGHCSYPQFKERTVADCCENFQVKESTNE